MSYVPAYTTCNNAQAWAENKNAVAAYAPPMASGAVTTLDQPPTSSCSDCLHPQTAAPMPLANPPASQPGGAPPAVSGFAAPPTQQLQARLRPRLASPNAHPRPLTAGSSRIPCAARVQRAAHDPGDIAVPPVTSRPVVDFDCAQPFHLAVEPPPLALPPSPNPSATPHKTLATSPAPRPYASL